MELFRALSTLPQPFTIRQFLAEAVKLRSDYNFDSANQFIVHAMRRGQVRVVVKGRFGNGGHAGSYARTKSFPKLPKPSRASRPSRDPSKELNWGPVQLAWREERAKMILKPVPQIAFTSAARCDDAETAREDSRPTINTTL